MLSRAATTLRSIESLLANDTIRPFEAEKREEVRKDGEIAAARSRRSYLVFVALRCVALCLFTFCLRRTTRRAVIVVVAVTAFVSAWQRALRCGFV